MEKSKYSPDMMIRDGGLSTNQLTEIQEKFITEYANKKGWNASKLSAKQLNEIKSQAGYKSNGLILG